MEIVFGLRWSSGEGACGSRLAEERGARHLRLGRLDLDLASIGANRHGPDQVLTYGREALQLARAASSDYVARELQGGYAGGLVKSATGRYATAFASRGAASAVKNSADSSGRGWSVTARTAAHQVAVAFLKDGSTPAGKPVLLTADPGTDHVNVHIAPYGKNRLLVSWESVTGASCKDGTCTGHFAGTHLRVVDWSGHTVTADRVVNARIAGDIAVLPDGSLAWAFAQATPDHSRPMGASSPTTTALSLARLRP